MMENDGGALDEWNPNNKNHSSTTKTTNSTTVENSQSSRSMTLFTPVVLCILITETAERFAYFGFRAVLVLYFKYALYLEETTAISFFAYTTCLANFSPILGAILADGSLGRFHTILCFGSLYAIGLSILTRAAFLHATILADNAADDNNNDDDNRGLLRMGEAGDLFWKRALTGFGLILVCIGTGGIKPCVNIFGADQVALRDRSNNNNNNNSNQQATTNRTRTDSEEEEEEEIIGRSATTQIELEISSNDDHAVREFFNFFYFAINVGATTSFAVIPLVKRYLGFGVAFLLPTIFMFFAISLFYSKRNEYIYRKTNDGESSSLLGTFRICFDLILQKATGRHGHHQPLPQQQDFHEPYRDTSPKAQDRQEIFQDETQLDFQSSFSSPSSWQETQTGAYQQSLEDAKQALKILPIMAMLPMFWLLYDQQGSVWTLQASRMALHGLEPEQLNLLNPLEIMIFIPLFDRIIYPAMEARLWNIAPLRRMKWGMVLAAISFVVSGLLEQVIEMSDSGSVHVLWQVPQITIMAVGEIFLSVTGLEYAYSKSPDRLKGFIMAVYLLTTATGDLLGGLLYSSAFRSMDRAVAMYTCAGFMGLNRFIFGRVVVATQQDTSSITMHGQGHAAAGGSQDEYHEPFSDHPNDVDSSNRGPATTTTRTSYATPEIELVSDKKQSKQGPCSTSHDNNDSDEDWPNGKVPKLHII